MDKMPIDQWKDAVRLAGFLKHNGPWIPRKLEPQMREVLEEDEELPDVAHLLDVLGRMVIAAHARVLRSDDDKNDFATEVAVARRELREEVMPELRERVKEVRKTMNTHMSRKTVRRILGGQGRTPRSDEGLENLATAMVRGLQVKEPIPTAAGDTVEPAKWAKFVNEPLTRVSELLITIDVYGGSTSAMVEKKGKVMQSYRKLFRRVSRLGWIFCDMAGHENAAGKLIYDGGRPDEKIKPTKGPFNVA